VSHIKLTPEARQRLVEACAQVSAGPAGRILLERLQQRLAHHKNTLTSCSTDEFQRLQGRAQELADVIDLITTGKDT
jgi:hypothetical protein